MITSPYEELRPLRVIAREIIKEWGSRVYFGAVPYLAALASIDSPSDAYGYDSGESIVIYFLSNARGFRGEKARQLKAELKAHLAIFNERG